ncbi:hypothetical protein [Kordia sp.]|uniref:hypothetical protein n=1 Tax=Kordia sp. TaxID=1965332 RepID=UPI003B59386B
MKSLFYSFLFFMITFSVDAQENLVFKETDSLKIDHEKIATVINFTFEDLAENEIIDSLRRKTKLHLNSLAHCMMLYSISKSMRLSEGEKKALENRVIEIAERFYSSNKYILFRKFRRNSDDRSMFIKDTFKGKKVAIILFGGNCVITRFDVLRGEIRAIFNTKMEALLSK